jgi:uncharacterized protein YbjT (DUF2867 family)
MERVLVLGATGLVGGHLIRTLAALPGILQIYALVRRPPVEAVPKVSPLVTDFERLDEIDLPHVPVVFCALGSTIRKAGSREAFRRVDYGYPMTLAERMARLGAEQFCLVSSVGADSGSPNFYLRVKAELERDVSALPFRCVHLFRPSFLTGERAEKRPGERVGMAVAGVLQFLLVGGLRKYRPIPAETVARAMAGAAAAREPGRRVYHYDEMVALSGRL